MGSSLKPEYFEEKVKLFIAMAPIARLDHSSNEAMVYGAKIYPILTELI